MSKIKTSNGYKNIDEVYSGETYITEIYDKNGNVLYTADREIQNSPPMTFKSRGKNLKNYRIYGNTVNGESIGDRTENLFDGVVELGTWNITTQPCSKAVGYQVRMRNANFIKVAENSTYSVTMSAEENVSLLIHFLDAQCNYISETTWLNNISNFNTPSHCEYINIIFKKGNNEAMAISDISSIMLNTGSEPLPYEPYGYKVPVTVEGKNLLLNTATSQGSSGVTFTVNSDGSVTCNGTASATTFFTCSSNITISKKAVLTGCPNDGGFYKYLIKIQKHSTSDSIVNDLGVGSGEFYQTDPIDVVIRIAKGYTCDNLTFYPMIRKADIEDNTYEPYHAPVTTPIYLPEQIKMVGSEAEYVDYAEQKQHRVRKNLLRNIAASKTIGGVTFTVNADGSVTCNGTNTANSAATFNISTYLLIGTYIINGCPKNGSLGTYSVDLRDPPNWHVLGERDTGLGFTFTNNTVRTVYYVIRINPGYTCDNLTFYPMIRKADIEDDTYEPYIENTDLDITLPALPTLSGTNTLSVGTEVQLSEVYVEGTIRAVS